LGSSFIICNILFFNINLPMLDNHAYLAPKMHDLGVREEKMSGKRTNRLAGQGHEPRGFTLIEVLVALFVLAVGLLALIQLQVAAISGLAYSRHFSVATQLAEGQMEKLMSYPFPETETNNIIYYPKDELGNNIEAQTSSETKASPFFDQLGAPDSLGMMPGDGDATRLWLLGPVNEQGQPARVGEPAYLVTWTVERGGSKGTPPFSDPITGMTKPYGFPGPYQIRFVVSVLWFEKGDKKNAWDDLIGNFVSSGVNGNLIWTKRATISGVREVQAQER